MATSRREFLITAGVVGALGKLWPQDARGQSRLATPEQARETQALPPEATQGPWKNLRAVREKKVIDYHSHTWETYRQDPTYKGTGLLHREGHYVNFTEQLIESMDRHGVAKACLSPAFVQSPFETFLEESYKKHPTRFVMMTVASEPPGNSHPTMQDRAKYLRQQVAQGARGLGEGGLPREWESPKDLQPFMDVVMEFGLPVMAGLHGWTATGTSTARAQEGGGGYRAAWRDAERFGALFAYYPEVTFVQPHTGGRFDFIDGYEALRLAFSFDNVYCETSKSTARIITEAVKGLGAEKVVFGSDWNRPQMKIYGPKHYRDVYQEWYDLDQVALAEITEDERDMILYKNAMRLLKLSA